MVLRIHFVFSKKESDSVISRIQNSSDSMEFMLRNKGIGNVLNMNTVADNIEISVKSKRYLGDVLKIAKLCLNKNNLLGSASFEVMMKCGS